MRVAVQPLHVMHADADADVPDASNCSSPLHLAGTWMNDLDRNEAVKFINHVTTVEKMPFFLYLATTTPHSGFLQGGSGPKPPGYVNDYPVPYPYGIARARAHTHTLARSLAYTFIYIQILPPRLSCSFFFDFYFLSF